MKNERCIRISVDRSRRLSKNVGTFFALSRVNRLLLGAVIV